MQDSITIKFIKSIPLSLRRFFAIALAGAFYHLSPKHRLIAIHNLLSSFPEKPVTEIIKIARESYLSFALVAAEFVDIPYLNKENLSSWITIEGLENYKEACREGKGVLLFGAHFGNWEIGNAALAITTQPFVFIYRRLDSSFLEDNITRVRASYGNVSLSKENAMRPIIRLLKKGATINMLIDQNVDWYDGLFVNFFGRKACTTSGLALLALHTDAPVLPSFTRRLPNGKYILEIGPKVEIIRTAHRDNDVLINTQNFTKIIEEEIHKSPEQWFWVHQRWKTKFCKAKRIISSEIKN
ncbi:MAG: lysophospholipid acyltransferase family protein [Smithellaceae bacterium]